MDVHGDSFLAQYYPVLRVKSSEQTGLYWLTPNNNRCFWNFTAWIYYLLFSKSFLDVLLYFKSIRTQAMSFSRIPDI